MTRPISTQNLVNRVEAAVRTVAEENQKPAEAMRAASEEAARQAQASRTRAQAAEKSERARLSAKEDGKDKKRRRRNRNRNTNRQEETQLVLYDEESQAHEKAPGEPGAHVDLEA